MNRLNSINRINRLNGPPKQGGQSWSSYWKPLSLFFLDGTIIEDEGSYYFKDASTNGRNFLITGYDFVVRVGFPYKSKATISAPAGDAVLIAADINNFLYDAGGTPNEIPVVSLFQDIDYEHTIFCQHSPQILNENGSELFEPRVLSVFMAADTLSASDLIKAQVEFDVPTEVTTNVRWVSKAGNDSTGNGSKANPWLTFAKADASATAGDTVYIKTGVYDESSGALPGTFYATKGLKYNAIGGVIMTSTGANYVMYTAGAVTYEFKGIIFDAEAGKNVGINCYAPNVSNSTFERCLIKRYSQTAYAGAVTHTTSFKNCVVIGNAAEGTQKFVVGINTLDTCLINNSTIWAYANNSFLNVRVAENKFTLCDIRNEITIVGGEFNHASQGFSDANSSVASNIDCKYATFTHHDVTGVTPLSINCSQNASTTAIVSYCNFTSTVNKANGRFVILKGATTIERNICNDTNTELFFPLQSGGGVSKMNYNYIHTNSYAGTAASIGGESSTSDTNNNSEFIGNRIIGMWADHPAVASISHLALITSGINIDIKYNHISHGNLGLVVKTNAQAYTSKGIQYNKIEETTIGIYIRGCTGINVYGNTVKRSGATYGNNVSYGIYADENSAAAGDQFSENIIMKNNIIDIDVAVGDLIGMDAHAAANGCVIEYSVLSGGARLILAGVTAYDTLAAAQAAGWAADCQVTDPGLVNMIPATPITIGEDLGTNYDDGIDVASTWGSSATLPSITTKQQEAAWQVGAYVQ